METPFREYKSISELTHFNPAVDADLFVDFETIGFYGKIRLAQFYQRGQPFVSIVEYPDPYVLAAFMDQFINIAHNYHYEATCLQANTGTRKILARAEDTLLLARLALPQRETFTLDDVMAHVLGYDPYNQQKLDKSTLQTSNWGAPVLTRDQKLYASTDVYYLPDVYDAVKKARDEFSYKLDMLTLNYCLDFQNNGMPVDKKRLFLAWDAAEKGITNPDCLVNAQSPKQVKDWLNLPATGDLELAFIALDESRTEMKYFGNKGVPMNRAAAAVRAVRKAKKQISFLSKFEETSVDGWIFGKFKPAARSGRLTSDDQNLQQLPRALKSVFGLDPDGDEIMIYADYAQIELRHICSLVGCKTMEMLFREGIDLHTYTADMIFGKFDVLFEVAFNNAIAEFMEIRGNVITTEEEAELKEKVMHATKALCKKYRQISKTCNFNFLYGGGIAVFIGILIKTTNILLSEKDANRARAKWRNLWKEIYAWQERGIAAWKKGRLGSTPLGRKYSSKMMTDQLNIENQGGAADVNKLAMHYLVPKLRAYNEEHGQNYRIANNIHDSYILIGSNVPVHYKAVAEILAQEMQRAWFECSKYLKVKDLPMPVEVKVGYNWGDIEDDDIPNVYDFELEPYAMLEAA